jgi:hypothetical protein
MTDRPTDAEFVERVLALMPAAGVPPSLEDRILADFVAVTARGRCGPGPLRSLAAALWPGASLWQPGAILAASLICGLTIGVAVAPGTSSTADPSVTMQLVAETVPAFDMLGDL